MDGKKHVYVGTVTVLYKAVQGKSGRAAKAKQANGARLAE